MRSRLGQAQCSQDITQIQQQHEAGDITAEQASHAPPARKHHQSLLLARVFSPARAHEMLAYLTRGCTRQAHQQVEQRKQAYLGQVAAIQQHFHQFSVQHQQQV